MPSARIERATLIVLVVLSLILLAMVIYPFASALFVAAVLAAAFMPWTERLAARLRGRQLAAGVVTLGALLLLVVPIAAVTLSLGKEAVAGIGYAKETMRSEGVIGLINDLPAPLRSLVEKALEQIPGGEERIQELTDTQGGRAAAALGGVLGATTQAIVQVVMMLIALFFLLIDGRALVEWLEDVAPLPRRLSRRGRAPHAVLHVRDLRDGVRARGGAGGGGAGRRRHRVLPRAHLPRAVSSPRGRFWPWVRSACSSGRWSWPSSWPSSGSYGASTPARRNQQQVRAKRDSLPRSDHASRRHSSSVFRKRVGASGRKRWPSQAWTVQASRGGSSRIRL